MTCPECQGKPWDRIDVHIVPCPVCDGSGRVENDDRIRMDALAEGLHQAYCYAHGPTGEARFVVQLNLGGRKGGGIAASLREAIDMAMGDAAGERGSDGR